MTTSAIVFLKKRTEITRKERRKMEKKKKTTTMMRMTVSTIFPRLPRRMMKAATMKTMKMILVEAAISAPQDVIQMVTCRHHWVVDHDGD